MSNLVNLLDQISMIGIIAIGMTLVILIGGIDLSVGSMVAFSGVILAECLIVDIPLPISIMITALSGLGLGLINGFLVTYGNVAPFIATLGMMSIARGGVLYITNGRAISDLSTGLSSLVSSQFAGIGTSSIVLILLSILVSLFLKNTYWGKFLYAIGGNEKAAWLSGIRVNKYKIAVYAFSGFASAIASVMLVGKLNSAQPQAGNMYELNAIAVVIIGGASLSGGRANISNTILGILVLGILQNGFSILNISNYYQQILVGLIIVVAVIIDSKKTNKYEKK